MERTQKKTGFNAQPQTGQKYRGGSRPYTGNVVNEVYMSGGRRIAKSSNLELFTLALLAGGFMCAATLFSVLIGADINQIGTQTLFSGLALTTGFLLVVLTKGVLFSEANLYIPANFYNLSLLDGCLRLFRFWVISWIGNLLGALIFAALIYACQEYSSSAKQMLTSLVATKIIHANGSLRGTGELILSGMLANWLIALAAFFAFASRNLVNQFILLFLVVSFVYVTNLQYFPFNLSYLCLTTFLGHSVGFFDTLFYNLIPVSLGNVLGATILVSGPLLFLSKR